MRHGQDARAHFGRHAERGKVSAAKGILRQPFKGNGSGAFLSIGKANLYTAEECRGQLTKKKEPEFQGAVYKLEKAFGVGQN